MFWIKRCSWFNLHPNQNFLLFFSLCERRREGGWEGQRIEAVFCLFVVVSRDFWNK